MDNNFQDMLKEFGEDKTSDADFKKRRFHEIMIKLMEQDELYILLSPDVTEEQFDNDEGNPRFAPNQQTRPSLWFFSTEENANAYAERFNYYVKKDDEVLKDKPLYKKVGTNQAANIVYSGIFIGVTNVIVDETMTFINFSATDFINVAFVSMKKEPLFNINDATYLELINIMKMCGSKCYIVADKDTPPHAIMSRNFRCDSTDDIIRIFDEKDVAENYAKQNAGHVMFAIETDIVVLAKTFINMMEDQKEYQVEINKIGMQYFIPFSKAVYLLSKMSIITKHEENEE